MSVLGIFFNQCIIPALIAWGIAQAAKVVIEYIHTRCWNWSLLFQAGGMPSSHSALVVGVTHAVGLEMGFDSPVYALGFILSMIVIYDATGIRRQSGIHAKAINQMITDIATGHLFKQEQVREVLGHTPLEALVGMLLGLFVSQMYWLIRQAG